ncbi:MAG TPA: hypothetical protein VE621_18455 [Bryobacteraceae bacterium]|nr:hypothetical protein [Bryobacteraceae bacterium]
MYSQVQAILWAQWRSTWNHLPQTKGWLPITLIIMTAWYGLWCFGAWGVFTICRTLPPPGLLDFLGPGLLLAGGYWQVIPVLMASTGLSLELKKLIVYPIPHRQLFFLEALLRVTTAVEMVLMTSGAALGLLGNPRVPLWAPLGLVLFMAMNLLFSVGLRDLLTRLFAHRRLREFLVIGLVMLTALPQLLVATTNPGDFRWLSRLPKSLLFPWTAAAHVGAGQDALPAFASLIAWTALTFWFGRSQFEHNLHFDAAEVSSRGIKLTEKPGLSEVLFRLPSRLFRDPLAILIEKELRSMVRSPRFRLTFIMGFSFGLLIWLPLAFRNGAKNGFLAQHFLTTVSVYALMLLGDVCVWNIFGFDRQAIQNYFVLPVPLKTVLIAKNISALTFFTLELLLITAMCLLFRFRLTPEHLTEAFVTSATFAIFLLGIGNLLSVRNPHPVNPTQSWRRTSAGSVQAFLFVVYAVFAVPMGLAFLARYAFESELAFYLVMLINFIIGAVVYGVTLDSALEHARKDKEFLLSRLSGNEQPIG